MDGVHFSSLGHCVQMHVVSCFMFHHSVCPLGAEIERLSADPAFVTGVLDDGAAKAQAIACETLADIKRHVGVGRL
jgi:hypothetical protein